MGGAWKRSGSTTSLLQGPPKIGGSERSLHRYRNSRFHPDKFLVTSCRLRSFTRARSTTRQGCNSGFLDIPASRNGRQIEMKRDFRGLVAAGSLLIMSYAVDPAFAQKTGGILKISHFDSP